MKSKILIVGASRGIGAAVSEYFVEQGADVLAVSRTPAAAGSWIKADVSTNEGIAQVLEKVGSNELEAFMYLGGIWEAGAFTDTYSFNCSGIEETRSVISVNLIAPIILAQQLSTALRKSLNPKIIFMGSLSGLNGQGSKEVANTASKFGLRGAAEAIRLSLPEVGVTILNPGNVGTQEVQEDIEQGRFGAQEPIPLSDIISSIQYVISLSSHTSVDELNISQRKS